MKVRPPSYTGTTAVLSIHSSCQGGSLNTGNINVFANYLLKCLQGFKSQGITVYAISIQNEPENSDCQ